MAKAAPVFDPALIGCDYCNLKQTWPQLHTPQMPLSGNKRGDVLALGEAPGKNEDIQGQIFIGASGRLLRNAIDAKHMARLAFQNVVRCRPPENRTPKPDEMHACSGHLERDIEQLNIKAILCCGAVPLHAFVPEAQILKIHGTRIPIRVAGKVVWMYPVFHPAFVLRSDQDGGSGKVKPVFDHDLQTFFTELDSWDAPQIVPLRPEDVLLPRSREDAEALLARMQDPIAVDLETSELYPYKAGAKLLTAAFSDGQTTFAFSVDHPEGPTDWGLSLLLDTVRKRRWIAHNCVPGDTEVLTPSGWIGFNKLPDNQELAQFDPATGTISFVVPTAILRRPYEGPMLEWDTLFHAGAYTPDHRMMFETQLKPGWRFAAAKDVATMHPNVPLLPCAGTFYGADFPLSVDEACLIEAIRADGAINHNSIRFKLKKERKKQRLAELCSRLDIPLTATSESRPEVTEFYLCKSPARDRILKIFGGNKDQLPWAILRTPLESRVAMIEEIRHWDGSDGKAVDCLRVQTANRNHVDFLQALAVCSGYRVRASAPRPNERGFSKPGGIIYSLSFARRRHVKLVEPPVAKPFHGMVYCVTVPSGAFIVRRNGRVWVTGNCSFELSWFRFHAGHDWGCNFEDTMALARLYHQRETLLSLEIQSRIHLGTNVKKVVTVDSRKISKYSLDQVLVYNGLDAMATAPIYHRLKDQVDKAGYKRFLRSIDSVVGMELQGLPVNQQTAQSLKVEWGDIASQQISLAKQMTSVEAWMRDTGVEFNIASPKQLANILENYGDVELPQTKKGNPSTAKKVLAELAEKDPLSRAVLDYREAVKLETTYIDHVLEVPTLYPDHMLHPGYTTMLTATARLSSTHPNIQNFPRRRNGNIRNMIEVPTGYVLLAFDYAQLEARVLAMASKDPVLCHGILTGRDIHADWRDNLLRIWPDYIDVVVERLGLDLATLTEKDLLKAIRDRVKNEWVFASFYGASVKSSAELMGVPLIYLEELAVQFWEEFAGVRRWIKARRVEYEKSGSMRTLTGRVRYQILYKYNEPVNTPVQGTAADIVAEAMNELTALSRKLKDPFLHPRMQIHDDLGFIVPEAQIEHYVEVIHPILTKVRFPWQIVPLAVEAKVGTRWGELEEFATFQGDYTKIKQ